MIPIRDDGDVVGVMILATNISELKATRAEVERLRRLLPICSWCERIHHEDGTWLTIEAHLEKEGGTRVSHVMCPDCYREKMDEGHCAVEGNGDVARSPGNVSCWDSKESRMPRSHHRTSPDWMLDEVASAGRENLDADHASRYDSKEDADAADELIVLQELDLNYSRYALHHLPDFWKALALERGRRRCGYRIPDDAHAGVHSHLLSDDLERLVPTPLSSRHGVEYQLRRGRVRRGWNANHYVDRGYEASLTESADSSIQSRRAGRPYGGECDD